MHVCLDTNLPTCIQHVYIYACILHTYVKKHAYTIQRYQCLCAYRYSFILLTLTILLETFKILELSISTIFGFATFSKFSRSLTLLEYRNLKNLEIGY